MPSDKKSSKRVEKRPPANRAGISNKRVIKPLVDMKRPKAPPLSKNAVKSIKRFEKLLSDIKRIENEPNAEAANQTAIAVENARHFAETQLTAEAADQAATAVENERLLAETQHLLKEIDQRAAELQIINGVQQGLAGRLEAQSIYDLVGDKICEIFNAQVVMISTYEQQTNTVEHRYAIERGERVYSPGPHPPGGFRSKIIQSHQPMLVNTNVAEESARLGQPALPGTILPKSWLGVPILVGEQVIGILSLQNVEQENAFRESDIRLLQMFAASMGLALENVRLFDETQNLLAVAGRARAETQTATRGLVLENWESFLGAARQKKSIGYSYDQNSVLPYDQLSPAEVDFQEMVMVMDEQIGRLSLKADPSHPLTDEDRAMAAAVAHQIAQKVDAQRLLATAERARAEAQAATRHFIHESWQSFMDAIRQKESIGYSYDQDSVLPCDQSSLAEVDFQEMVTVMDEQIGRLSLKAAPSHPLTDEDKTMVAAVTRQIAQQVENLRLLADASRARADAEEATRRLMHESWQSFAAEHAEAALGFMYDSVQVTPLRGASLPQINFAQPLTVRGETIGQLAVAGWENVPPEAIVLASAMAERVSVHIENLRLFEQNEKRAHELGTVAAVSTTASTVLNPDELLQSVVDLTKERFNLYHAHIYLADASWNTLLLAAGAGEVGRQMVSEGHAIQMDVEKSLVARATRERQAIIVNDVRSEADFLPNPLLPEIRSEMAVPMIVGDKVLGVFDVQSDIVGHFTEEDASIYATLAAQVGVALQNARLYVEQSATVTQLRELDRLKSSFLANMSHELRTPLNSILGFADVMLEELDGPLTENMANDLSLIYKNGQHLLHLINDVLDMAKIESGRMNLSLEKFRVHDIIEEVVSITAPLASEKNLSLFIEQGSDQEIEINADRTRIRQVMINIINNAIKFTEKGKISTRVTQQGEQVLITIRDTGIGIPPDQLETVFQEFIQVDISSTRKAGGTGLGLPISRKLVEMHGGRLWVESTGVDGEGST
ncbi:MAG: GAF domain-containing protein, partial [Anaerolineales bacterium]|nr:GAF domain-containing protein [Anaerolineales bacterium]